MFKKLKRVFSPSNRSLIRELVASDFKLRYQNSVLGYFWTLLRPLLLFGILFIVFTKVLPAVSKGIPYYPSYLLLGLVLWTFFVESTVAGMNAISSRGDLIRKVSIPKYTIVISTTISATVNFCLNMVIVFVFMFFGDVPFRINMLLAIPFFLELVVFSLGISFLLSTLYVKFKDFGHIWDVVLQALFYATPIIYALSRPSHKMQKILSLNPLAQIIQDIRYEMITPLTLTTKEVYNSELAQIIPVIGVTLLLILTSLYFRHKSKSFAEDL